MSRNKYKTNNAKDLRKLNLRTENISNIESKSVIELFCGKGYLFTNVYRKAKRYIGVDIIDYNSNVVCDSLKYAANNDLSNYDIIDIDPYGSPYGVLNAIKRINGKTVFFITDGLYTDLSMGNICSDIRNILNLHNDKILKANRIHLLLIKNIISKIAEKHNSEISNFVIFTGKTGAKVKYYTFTLTKKNSQLVGY